MKSAIRRWLDVAGENPAVWSGYRGLNGVGSFVAKCLGYPYVSASMARLALEDSRLALQVCPGLTVLAGPFRGMRYPRARSAGSTLVPKLLGSYERELHAVIEGLIADGFTDIVDIGCAEGYYAVGFASRLPQASVWAFDTDNAARALCLEMAQLNNVADRVTIGGFCDEAALLELALDGRKTLVISDCEGYEVTLFTRQVARALAGQTLLIEVHDLADEALGDQLKRRFESTHVLTVIESIDDRRKPEGYVNEALVPYDIPMRRRLLAERRGGIMQWFLLRPSKPRAG